ncbi:MAG: thermonuclease family protein [Patescibacteria group bacterium]|nr:thermonuclease family protein [Patescibacteria group bacterium]
MILNDSKRKISKSRKHIILAALSVFTSLIFAFQLFQSPQKEPVNHAQLTSDTHKVVKVIDGDTIVLANGDKVRYIGVNSPEIHKDECFGKESKRRNEELVLNNYVVLKKDVSETDKYKRLLRYVYLPDGTFVNKKIVQEGYAYASSYPPDISLQEELREAQKDAQQRKQGLWSACR